MSAELKELVISRAKWGKRALLRDDGKKCCLGFAASACGIPDEKLRRPVNPNDKLDLEIGYTYSDPLLSERDKMPNWLSDVDFAERAARLNDFGVDGEFGARQEKALVDLFAANGCALTFVD